MEQFNDNLLCWNITFVLKTGWSWCQIVKQRSESDSTTKTTAKKWYHTCLGWSGGHLGFSQNGGSLGGARLGARQKSKQYTIVVIWANFGAFGRTWTKRPISCPKVPDYMQFYCLYSVCWYTIIFSVSYLFWSVYFFIPIIHLLCASIFVICFCH